ncbi:LemA family protein [Flavobacterium sp. SUN052]|uniref:LemA family protein n=1 Tax=Flavobacterium sp. SUN052 TaxID=3002441 RepID=UPI00237DFA19|nr:LemA family protein [Flavobacterium sp. SUN052]MEC4003869.1 LemA family protein [Flavobacterium sp. SUN052]
MVFLVLILLVIGFVIFVSYNSIIIKRNAVEKAYSTLDAVLKKRYDMLPNVVASVQQAMTFEGTTLEKIVSLRNATSTTNLQSDDRIQQENELSSLLSKVLVTVERYPDLKSNSTITNLQRTILDIEEQIANARDYYNNNVLAYNNQIETIPSTWVAKEMGATRKNYFESVASERENVSVKDLFKE